MSKTIRNYCLDVALFLLLGVNVASLVLTHNDPSAGISPAHIASGALLVLLSLVHICMHWRWFRAVLSGKAKGKIKVMMDSLVTILLLLAGLSGPLAAHSTAASQLHNLSGSLALLGLLIHSVKHLSWMAAMTRKLFAGLSRSPASVGVGNYRNMGVEEQAWIEQLKYHQSR